MPPAADCVGVKRRRKYSKNLVNLIKSKNLGCSTFSLKMTHIIVTWPNRHSHSNLGVDALLLRVNNRAPSTVTIRIAFEGQKIWWAHSSMSAGLRIFWLFPKKKLFPNFCCVGWVHHITLSSRCEHTSSHRYVFDFTKWPVVPCDFRLSRSRFEANQHALVVSL